MDEILESLTGFAEGFTFNDLSEEALYQAKRRARRFRWLFDWRDGQSTIGNREATGKLRVGQAGGHRCRPIDKVDARNGGIRQHGDVAVLGYQ